MVTRTEVWIDKNEISPSKAVRIKDDLIHEGYKCRETDHQLYFFKIMAVDLKGEDSNHDIRNREQRLKCV